jgi:hypothetical protein
MSYNKIHDYPNLIKYKSSVLNNNTDDYKKSLLYKNNQLKLVDQSLKIKELEDKIEFIINKLKEQDVVNFN